MTPEPVRVGGSEKNSNIKKRPRDEKSEVESLLLPSLKRLTEGLPLRELKMMITEAKSCEEMLEREIKQLQQALDDKKYGENKELQNFVDVVMESEVTPADSFFTVSALLGRLRDELAMPLPPNSSLPAHRAQIGLTQPPNKKKKKEESSSGAKAADSGTLNPAFMGFLEKQNVLVGLKEYPEYTREHATNAQLMSLWKKISNHRASIVFRRPVNPKEAPGYAEKIVFPVDLSMIRKMIVAGIIKSYADIHQRIGLVCHNCMKFNGRESDYGVVAREFEANADDFIINAVINAVANPPSDARAGAAAADGSTKEGPQGAQMHSDKSATVVQLAQDSVKQEQGNEAKAEGDDSQNTDRIQDNGDSK